jgi:hypothetical protein
MKGNALQMLLFKQKCKTRNLHLQFYTHMTTKKFTCSARFNLVLANRLKW